MSGSSIIVAANAVALKRLRLPESGPHSDGKGSGRVSRPGLSVTDGAR
jgi:hypothetical protein